MASPGRRRPSQSHDPPACLSFEATQAVDQSSGAMGRRPAVGCRSTVRGRPARKSL
jgi:hypothetical protein